MNELLERNTWPHFFLIIHLSYCFRMKKKNVSRDLTSSRPSEGVCDMSVLRLNPVFPWKRVWHSLPCLSSLSRRSWQTKIKKQRKNSPDPPPRQKKQKEAKNHINEKRGKKTGHEGCTENQNYWRFHIPGTTRSSSPAPPSNKNNTSKLFLISCVCTSNAPSQFWNYTTHPEARSGYSRKILYGEGKLPFPRPPLVEVGFRAMEL